MTWTNLAVVLFEKGHRYLRQKGEDITEVRTEEKEYSNEVETGERAGEAKENIAEKDMKILSKFLGTRSERRRKRKARKTEELNEKEQQMEKKVRDARGK